MNVEPSTLEEAPIPAAGRRRRWIALAVAVAVLAGLAGSARPAYRGLKSWRAGRLATAAEQAIAGQRWEEAANKVQAAYQLAPLKPQVVRTMARLHDATGRPAVALQFWLRLKELKVSEPADRRSLAEDFLRVGALAEAQAEIQALLAGQPREAGNHRLAAQAALAAREGERAIFYAERARELAPGDAQHELLLAGLQLGSGTAVVRAEGAQALLRLAADRGALGLEALQTLATQRSLPPEMLAQVSTQLREHPLATPAHQLLALDLELALRPAEKTALLTAAMARYRAAEPESQRSFGTWLNGRREFARVLELLPVETAFARKDLLLVHLDALAGLRQWAGIEQILSRKQVPLDEVYAELFLARAAMEQGKISEADGHWRRAQLAAARSPEQMMFLGSYAEKIGEHHQAALAFRTLTSNSSAARPAYEALLRLAEKGRDTAVLRGLLGEMKTRWPNDAAVLNDYAYMSLLLDKDVPECRRLAAGLVAKAPGSLPHRTTLALAAFRQRDAAAGLAVFEGLQIPWAKVAPGARSVYAAVLGLGGKETEARALAAGLRAEELRAEELELVRPWMKP